MQELVDRHRLHARLRAAVAHRSDPLPTPAMVVDLDAFDQNARDLARRAEGTPIRVASKSLRVPALIERALGHAGFRGVLTYALREALWLHQERGLGDLVMGYPTVDQLSLTDLVSSPSAATAITLMIDSTDHLDVVDAVRSSKAVPVRIAIDVDAGLQLRGQHLGPKRSPLRSVEKVIALAREVVRRPGFVLVGVMTYEGQVAGLPDDVPGQWAKSMAVRGVKAASIEQLRDRRRTIADALAQIADLEFWNAGGSGSIQSSAADPVVTEVAAGSGLLVPGLFDHYRSFDPRPAAFYAVPVLRKPAPDIVTVAGGGFVASGPAGRDRLPLPWLPPGLRPTATEGIGEVQTPLIGSAAETLATGDLVWFRHAKSGELFEHTNLVHLLRDTEFVGAARSYRGHGQAF